MVAEHWQKSSFCAESSNCVELAADTESTLAGIRESTSPDLVLFTTLERLNSLLRAVKSNAL